MAKLSTTNEEVFLILGRLGAQGRSVLAKFLTIMFKESTMNLSQLVLVPMKGTGAYYITRIFEGNPNSYHFSLHQGRIPSHLRSEERPNRPPSR